MQAYFDGELDAISAADIERHREVCAECRALLYELGEVRNALREVIGSSADVRIISSINAPQSSFTGTERM